MGGVRILLQVRQAHMRGLHLSSSLCPELLPSGSIPSPVLDESHSSAVNLTRILLPSCCKQAWLLKKSLFVPMSRNLGDTKCLGDPRKSILGLPDAILFLPILREGVFQQPQAITLRTLGRAPFR